MRTSILAVSAASLMSGIAFAKASEGSGAAAPAPVDPALAAFGLAAFALPDAATKSTRGGQSKYPFDKLDAPVADPANPGKFLYHSFGVVGKTAKNMASTVSSANKREMIHEKNEDGTNKFVAGDKGVMVPVMVEGKVFKAYPVATPEADPIKATVRVYRIK
jgi:hypothetical protein